RPPPRHPPAGAPPHHGPSDILHLDAVPFMVDSDAHHACTPVLAGEVTGSTPREGDDMDHDRTVPRALVHKAGPEAVWITDLEKVDADHYHCVGQVPRAHSYINDAVPPLHTYYDLGLLSELGRQAGIATMHEFEGVDVKAPTVFMKFDLAVVDPVLPNDRTPAPVTAEMDITYLNREFADGV